MDRKDDKIFKKGKKGHYSGRRKVGRRADSGKGNPDVEVRGKFNDVSWYAYNPQMLKDAASYSFNSPLGYSIPKPVNDTELYQNDCAVIPGLMSLRFAPTIGISARSDSPANTAANIIYAYVRYMNSGAKNYDQADLMLYLLAMDSMYYMWNWGKRIYGYCRMYEQENRYAPGAFGIADNIDLASFQDNLADFRLYLNKCAAQIMSFNVPAVMNFYVRHSWMVSNIYKDSDTEKAQLYMFNPTIYYEYSETGSSYGGSLNARPIYQGRTDARKFTLTDYKRAFRGMLDKLAYSEDIGVMSGDIRKAYGEDKLFKLTPVTEDYTVEPVYNEEVLNQIHNSTVVPMNYWSNSTQFETGYVTSFKVTQNPNTGFLVTPLNNIVLGTDSINGKLTPHNHMLNMPWQNPTPENVIVGTRLMTVLTYDPENADTMQRLRVETCGTEIVVDRAIISKSGITGEFMTSLRNTGFLLFDDTLSFDSVLGIVHFIGQMTNFDWHPLVAIYRKPNTAGAKYQFMGYLGDISNYTVLNTYDVTRLNDTAIMSEFAIPYGMKF